MDFVIHRAHQDLPHVRLHPHGSKLKSGLKEAKPVYGVLEHWMAPPGLQVPAPPGLDGGGASSPAAPVAASLPPAGAESFYDVWVRTTTRPDHPPPPPPAAACRHSLPPPPPPPMDSNPGSSSDGARVTYEATAAACPRQDVIGRRDAIEFLRAAKGNGVALQSVLDGKAFPWHRYLMSSTALSVILRAGVCGAWAVGDSDQQHALVFKTAGQPHWFTVRPGGKPEVTLGIAHGLEWPPGYQ